MINRLFIKRWDYPKHHIRYKTCYMVLKSILHRFGHLLPLILFGVAIFIVNHEIKIHNIYDISGAIHSVPLFVLGSAAILTILNYVALAGYDVLALKYTGHKIPLIKVMLASLVGYAISNNTGHAWATGGSVRYRFYNAWKIPGWDIMKISLFLALTYVIGVLTMGLAGTVLMPDGLRNSIENPEFVKWLGFACGGILAAYWLAVLFWRKPLTIKGISLNLPTARVTLAQTVVSCIDLLLASLVLWVLLAGRVDIQFETFILMFVIAQVAGLFSQVPGGIGVFEGAFLWLAEPVLEGAHLQIVSALILYRIIYYFIPLGIAGITLLIYEAILQRKQLATVGQYTSKALAGIVPHIFSVLLLIAGAVLLVSGATPSVPENMEWLKDMFPLPVIEASHMIGSLIGVLLLFLARGIRLRIDAAWYGSILLLASGVLVSLLKDLDWQDASVLIVMLVLMLPTKSYFRRHSSLLTMSFTPGWIILTGAMLAGAAWIGFFSFRYVEYANDLWWQFSYKGDAPRFLRAVVIIVTTVTVYALWRLTSIRKSPALHQSNKAELDSAQILAEKGTNVHGFLSVLGDKNILWSDTKQSFIMFAAEPKYWIAMGDPVGSKDEFEALLWRFRENADKAGAKIVFYQVSQHHLPLYMDIGLVMLKMGEEALIPLSDFTLEGKKRQDLRGGRNKLTKLDYSFAVLKGNEVVANMARLKEISDLWSSKKNAREKGFSLGFFDEDYIARTSVAVIHNPEGQIMAFANLWQLDSKEEMSIDLMRYDPQSPSGIMDYLFAELMLWGREQGFQWFSLGMAPLAGLKHHPLAPLWHKIGTAVYELGEEFYNFEGLYEYKAKFEPQWRPRYLAAPTGLSAPLIIMTVSRLIARGTKMLKKQDST